MRLQYWILTLLILCGCKDNQLTSEPPQTSSEATTTVEWKGYALGDFVDILTPILDPAKLDTLKGKRAATPRLRKACYWLQIAHTNDFDIGEIIDLSHDQVGPVEPLRAKAQRASLIRNRLILERLGCFDEAGLAKLRKGNAPTITKGH